MSVFFNHTLPYNDEVPSFLEKWSDAPGCTTLLAAAGKDRSVSLFREEGEMLSVDVTRKTSNAEVSALAWHPSINWLISGWSDGALVHWSEKNSQQRDEKTPIHRNSIQLISFNPAGTRLITTDTDGVCIMWQVDIENQTIKNMKKISKEGVMNHVVWRSNSGRITDTPPFFIAGTSGTVFTGDDQFSLVDRFRLGGPINALEYLPMEDRVVAMTTSGVVSSFQLDNSGGLIGSISLTVRGGSQSITTSNSSNSLGSKNKTPSSPSSFKFCWISDGALITCHGASLLRVWNVSTACADSFVLPLINPHGDRLSKESVTDVTFNPYTRTLACVTSSGTLLQWSVSPPGLQTSSTSPFSMASRVTTSVPSFGFSECSFLPTSCTRLPTFQVPYVSLSYASRVGFRALAVKTLTGKIILSVESSLARSTAAPLAVVQNGPHSFLLQTLPLSGAAEDIDALSGGENEKNKPIWAHLVQERSAQPPAPVLVPYNDCRLRGLAIAPPLVAAWGLDQLHVFNVTSKDGSQLELVSCITDIIHKSNPDVVTTKKKQQQPSSQLTSSTVNQSPDDFGVLDAAISVHAPRNEPRIYIARGNRVEIWDLQGTIIKTLHVSTAEDGIAESICESSGLLVCSTSKGKLLSWQQVNPKSDDYRLLSSRLVGANVRCERVALNSNGSQLGIIAVTDAATASLFSPNPTISNGRPLSPSNPQSLNFLNTSSSALNTGNNTAMMSNGSRSIPKATRLQKTNPSAVGAHMMSSTFLGCLSGTSESVRIALAYSFEHDTFRKIETGQAAEPRYIAWDSSDPRTLALETHPRFSFGGSTAEDLIGDERNPFDARGAIEDKDSLAAHHKQMILSGGNNNNMGANNRSGGGARVKREFGNISGLNSQLNGHLQDDASSSPESDTENDENNNGKRIISNKERGISTPEVAESFKAKLAYYNSSISRITSRNSKSPELWSFIISPDSAPAVQDFVPLKTIASESQSGTGVPQSDKDLGTPFFASLSIVLPFAYVFALYGHSPQTNGADGGDEQNNYPGFDGLICRRVLQTFECLENASASVFSALTEFCARLASGDTEGAYAAVRMLKQPLVWSTLARMAVHTRRLDVAIKCLSLMEAPIASACARKALLTLVQTPGVSDYLFEDDSLNFDDEVMRDVQLSVVADHLGLTEEAIEILKQTSRFDLLIALYIRHGMWHLAVREAELREPLGMSSVLFQWAKHCESLELHDAAAELFMRAANAASNPAVSSESLSSKNHLYQQQQQSTNTFSDEDIGGEPVSSLGCENVIRMFASIPNDSRLNELANRSSDPSVHKWLAKLWEVKGDLSTAANEARKANAYGDLVRACCEGGDEHSARRICEDVGAASACYVFGKYLEQQLETGVAQDRQATVREAIKMFGKAGTVIRALKLAEKSGIVSSQELFQLAINAPPRARAKSAMFFEHRGQAAAAALLYTKAGHVEKALEVCVRHNLIDTLRKIASDLSRETVSTSLKAAGLASHSVSNGNDAASAALEKSVDAILNRCAELLSNHGLFGCAARLYGDAGLKEKAVYCLEQFVNNMKQQSTGVQDETVSEGTIDKAMPTTTEGTPESRVDLLKRLGAIAKTLRLYQAACRAFTKAGDRSRAVKCLIRAGNVDAVIYFASKARDSAVYILAANFLQSQSWRGDAKLTKSICSFYERAGAFDKLADFYSELAIVEIDEFRDYDSAVRAVEEALKVTARLIGTIYEPSDLKTAVNPAVGVSPQLLKNEKAASLLNHKWLISRFLYAKEMYSVKHDLESFASGCEKLLSEGHTIDECVREGDLLAEMATTFSQERMFERAADIVQRMVDKGLKLDPYIETSVLEKIMRNTGRHFALSGVKRGGAVSSAASSPARHQKDLSDDDGY